MPTSTIPGRSGLPRRHDACVRVRRGWPPTCTAAPDGHAGDLPGRHPAQFPGDVPFDIAQAARATPAPLAATNSTRYNLFLVPSAAAPSASLAVIGDVTGPTRDRWLLQQLGVRRQHLPRRRRDLIRGFSRRVVRLLRAKDRGASRCPGRRPVQVNLTTNGQCRRGRLRKFSLSMARMRGRCDRGPLLEDDGAAHPSR